MRRKFILITMTALFAVGISSCREESTGEEIEDATEEMADDVEDSVD
jgi:hypothetical protein